MITSIFTSLFLLLLHTNQCNGFVTPNLKNNNRVISRSKSSLNIGVNIPDLPSEDARRLFFLWFFGGSGGGGIAIGAFPKMYERFTNIQSLKNAEPSLKGETVGLPYFLLGYPEDLYVKDVEKILNNKMSVERMVATGPKDSFWAEKGYLRIEAFEKANKNCNPLALRAVFDALTTSTSIAEPDKAQALLDSFKKKEDGLEEFKKKLIESKFRGWSSIVFLLFLLGLATDVSVQALARGWFPDWPGNANFPLSIVDPGIWTIPQYWT